jgi:fibronectin type 3 domain-containing protein
VTHSLYGTIKLFIGLGDGTFWEDATYHGYYPSIMGVLSADFNYDGKLDLIIYHWKNFPDPLGKSNYELGFSVLMGRGDGTFDLGGEYFSDVVLGVSSTIIPKFAKDVTGDGYIDVVGVDYDTRAIIFPGRGDGTFGPPFMLDSGGDTPISIDRGDFNNDGLIDLVVANIGFDNLSIIFGKGEGSFRATTIYEAFIIGYNSFGKNPITTADLNGDKSIDIIVTYVPRVGNPLGTNWWGLKTFLGSGDGTFTEYSNKTVSKPDGEWPINVVAEDFDGDNIPDIFVSTYLNFYIFLGKGDGSFYDPLSIKTKKPSYIGKAIPIDYNNDDKTDIISINSYQGAWLGTGDVSFFTNSGDGTFTLSNFIEFNSTVEDIAKGFFNNDSYPDIAIIFQNKNTETANLLIYLGNGNIPQLQSEYSWTKKYSVPSSSINVNDFNGDGNQDLAIYEGISGNYTSIWYGRGDGTFEKSLSYYTPNTVLSSDFNQDGRIDLISAEYAFSLSFNTLPPLFTSPDRPTGLKAKPGDSIVALLWDANSEPDIAGYNIYRSLFSGGGYQKINTVPVVSTSFQDSGLSNGTVYYYAVSAVDTDGDESVLSEKVRVIPNPVDTEPPILTITSPLDGSTVYLPYLTVSGYADEPLIKVTVNALKATVWNNTSFIINDIFMEPGINTINVVAIDNSGNISTKTISVDYKPRAAVKGKVTDNAGTALEFASVSVEDTETTRTISTDSDGSFIIVGIIPGDITIIVSLDDYETKTIQKAVSSGEELYLDIILKPTSATYTGTVVDGSKCQGFGEIPVCEPISGATVTVTDSEKSQSVVTGTDGSFTIENITPGDASINVTKLGYKSYAEPRYFYSADNVYERIYLYPIPSTPTGLIAYPGDQIVVLKWNPNPEPEIWGYRIWRSTASGGPYESVNFVSDTTVTDKGLINGITYYYVITAVNNMWIESAYSNEVSATPEVEEITISITFPTDGSVIGQPDVMVTGTFNSEAQEVGINVNGVLANIYGNQFVANNVPLQEGSNTIVAEAIDSNGYIAQATVNVTMVPAPYVTLTANIESGIPPLTVYFSISTDIPNAVSIYQIDFEGDGVVDYTGSTFEDMSHTYTTEGIYYPTVTVTDTQGNTYSDAIAIVVLNKTEIDALLKDKWEGMKEKLQSGDIERMVEYFDLSVQDIYREQFNALKSVANEIFGELNTAQINLVEIDDIKAEYELLIVRDGVALSFHLVFVKDSNGFWKIWRF